MQRSVLSGFQFLALVLLAVAQAGAVETSWPRMVESSDGTPIAYEVHGHGEPTLVFVHGWNCDGRYWRAQVPRFADRHRVVVVDLAGHGHSGLNREKYTLPAFGDDVRAVVADVGAEQVILIGHSMGGAVIAHAAAELQGRVLGLVGLDTFHNIAETITREQLESWVAPMRADFRQAAEEFVSSMFVDRTDAGLREWIVSDMSAAPPEVAVGALEQYMSASVTGQAAAIFEGVDVPVVAINADLWPTDVEANRRHMRSFEAVIVNGADHFLHLARPQEVNRYLASVIDDMTDSAD